MCESEIALWSKYEKRRTVVNRNELVLYYYSIAEITAKKVVSKCGILWDDLFGYANLGLINAVERFDRSRGWEFTTYAYRRVYGSVIDGVRECRWFRERCRDGVLNETDRPPIQATGTVLDSFPVEDDFTKLVEDKELEELVLRLEGMLREKERYIFRQVYREGKTNREVAREVGVSESRISQIMQWVEGFFLRELGKHKEELVA